MRCSGVGSKSARSAAAGLAHAGDEVLARRAPASDRSSAPPLGRHKSAKSGAESQSRHADVRRRRPAAGTRGRCPSSVPGGTIAGDSRNVVRMRADSPMPAHPVPSRLSRRRLPRHPLAALGGLVAAASVLGARAQADQAHLRIMATTDLHCHVLPYDYYADKPNDTMGLSRTASLIEAIRAEATNALLVDNGDFLQGNPMGDYIAYEKRHEGRRRPPGHRRA